jgi:hypothetical protein
LKKYLVDYKENLRILKLEMLTYGKITIQSNNL